MKSLLLGAAMVCLLAAPTAARAQSGEIAVVTKAKADLQKAGVDLSGACGAFRITNLVAWYLRPSYGFLVKHGGNRAIVRGDGTCINGDNPGDGYATDYLIDKQTGFGYDILSDGGSSNGPQWGEPETDAEMVKRNRANFAEPFNWSIVPGPVDPGHEPPSPATIDLGPVNARIDALQAFANDVLAQLKALSALYNAQLVALTGRVSFLESRPIPTSCKASLFGFGVHCELQ